MHKCTIKPVPTETQRSLHWCGKRRVSAEHRIQSFKTTTTLQGLLAQDFKTLHFWEFELKFSNLWKQPNKCALLRSLNLGQKWGYSNLVASLRNPGFCILWLNKNQQLPFPFLTPWKVAVWSSLICLGTLYTVILRNAKRVVTRISVLQRP